MTTAPTYSCWNTRNVVSLKNSVHSTSSLPKRRSGLSVPKRRIASSVGHPLERRLEVDVDELPQLGDDGLAELEHVVLLDEGHLDVELGELRLAVGAEVLVAVAAGDLVVALHARDHEQLLEQLGALREGVPAAGREACRHEEVAGPLGRGAGQRGGLDLDEVTLGQDAAGCRVDLRAQPQGVAGGPVAGAAQVEVAVLEAGLLADRDPLVDLEGQRRALVEHLDALGDDLDVAGGQVGVGVALGAQPHLADDLDDVLVAQVVGVALGEHLVAHDHLRDAGAVPEIEEGHSAVIAPTGNPARERDGLAGVVGTQGAGLMGAEHERGPIGSGAVVVADNPPILRKAAPGIRTAARVPGARPGRLTAP